MIRCIFCGYPSQTADGETVRCICGNSYVADSTANLQFEFVRCKKCGSRRSIRVGLDPNRVLCACERGLKMLHADAEECIHRGQQLRLEPCTTCNGSIKIKIYQCYIHGECSIAPHKRGLQACLQCKDLTTGVASNKKFITTADLMKDTIKLLNKLPCNVAGIAGIPRSGMMPATLLSTMLHVPLYTLTHQGLTKLGCGWRLSDTIHQERPGPIIVVDDTSMYGNAMAMAKVFWRKFEGDRDAVFATVYCSPKQYHKHGPMPDVFAVELNHPHILEWCLFNCGFAKRIAFDFDGILTFDGTEKALYKPLKYPIELIVTGRLEVERQRSENWLNKHGIQYRKMIMWPWSMEDRKKAGPHGVAEFKAKHYKKTNLEFFVESHPEQAAEIARIAKKTVICPTIARIFS